MIAAQIPPKIRYAVVGLGHIAQVAVLPAFQHAKENSELTALVSGDPEKLKQLGAKYHVPHTYSYDQFDECLRSGNIDAIYIALPNHLHCEYTVRAAEAGIHVLCEKPMAVTEDDCRKMIDATRARPVKLMIAYRLHFEAANLKAIELAQSGRLGELRLFDSVFTMQVREGNVRTRAAMGGGPLFDIGVYCINAARYLFRDEPEEVFATHVSGADPRFAEVPEMTSVMLRFPNQRVASFTVSFGAADVSSYRIVGTEGDLRVDPAYAYAGPLEHHLTRGGKTTHETFPKRDQFAPELVYFSECVREDRDPEPSGLEGLADMRVVQASLQSAESRRSVRLGEFQKMMRPTTAQRIDRAPISEPDLIHVASPSV